MRLYVAIIMVVLSILVMGGIQEDRIDNYGEECLTSGPDMELLPSWSPDGTRIAYTVSGGPNEGIWVMDADGKNKQRLTNLSIGEQHSVWHPTENKIAFHGNRFGSNFDLFIFDLDTQELQQITYDLGDDMYPSWSPDGRKIAFASFRSGNEDVWEYDVETGQFIQLTDWWTDEPGWPSDDGWPVYSHSGELIAFPSFRYGSFDVCIMNADGSNVRQVTYRPLLEWGATWSPDDSMIAYCAAKDITGDFNIWVINVDGTESKQLTTNPGNDWYPSWHPDGKKIAYCSSRDSNWDIYVMQVKPKSGLEGSPLTVDMAILGVAAAMAIVGAALALRRGNS